MKKGRRPRRRPRLKLSDKAGPDQCPVPGENALFPAQIAGFLAVSRPVPVYPVFLNYVVPVHQRIKILHLLILPEAQKVNAPDREKEMRKKKFPALGGRLRAARTGRAVRPYFLKG